MIYSLIGACLILIELVLITAVIFTEGQNQLIAICLAVASAIGLERWIKSGRH